MVKTFLTRCSPFAMLRHGIDGDLQVFFGLPGKIMSF